ncbi:uncharacterized protein LOC144712625 [Wolffia australiana]
MGGQQIDVVQGGQRSVSYASDKGNGESHGFEIAPRRRITPDSKISRQIYSASMIIMEEAPIVHCHVYEMLDQSIRDVMKTINASLESVPFGGKVYGTFEDGTTQLITKMILTPLNGDVVKVNDMVLDVFPGEEMEYFSFNAIPPGKVHKESLYPTEFLNTTDDVTMPLHMLRLKIGCIMILLRNLNNVQGLCNGIRLRMDGFFQTMLQATIVSQGNFYGEVHLLPWIALYPSQSTLQFHFKCLQFPV